MSTTVTLSQATPTTIDRLATLAHRTLAPSYQHRIAAAA
jgi:hypothetical protein